MLGHSYERSAVTEWFESGHTTSPLTNTALSNTTLVANHALRSAIQEYVTSLTSMPKDAESEEKEVTLQSSVEKDEIIDLQDRKHKFKLDKLIGAKGPHGEALTDIQKIETWLTERAYMDQTTAIRCA